MRTKRPSVGVIPKAYMIQFTAQPATDEARQQRMALLAQARTQWNISSVTEFDLLMNAVSLEITGDGAWSAGTMSSMPSVRRVWPVTIASGHSPVVHTAGSAMFNATHVRHNHLVPRATIGDPNGVKVGIIDSGVDYKHHHLGGCFGTGCFVSHGYDFVGDAYTGRNKPVPDSDPMDECNGHGTHVAGLSISGLGRMGIRSLGAYRVLGCAGSTSLIILTQAMERTAVDGMDIVNISIGSGLHFASYADAIAAQRLVDLGIIVIASAGNDGELGMGGISSPGTAPGVIAVAAAYMTDIENFSFSYDGKSGYTYLSSIGRAIESGKTVTLIDLRSSADPYGCNTATRNYAGSYPLVKRGRCDLGRKAHVAQTAGAAGIVVHSDIDDAEYRQPATDNSVIRIPVLLLNKTVGDALRSPSGDTISVTGDVSNQAFFNVGTGTWATFSSVGPSVASNVLKPDVSARGTSRISLFPRALGSQAIMSGTSMAAPVVTRAVAYAYRRTTAGENKAGRVAAVRRAMTGRTITARSSVAIRPAVGATGAYLEPMANVGAGRVMAQNYTSDPWGLEPMSLSLVGTPQGKHVYTINVLYSLTGKLPAGTVSWSTWKTVAYSRWDSGRETEPLLWMPPIKHSHSPVTQTIAKSYTDGTINTVRPITSTFSFSVDISAYPNRYWSVSGLVLAKIGHETIRSPFHIHVGNPANIMPLDTAATSLLLANAQGIVPGATTFSVRADGIYTGIRFRLNYPSEKVFVIVEHANTRKQLGIAGQAYGEDIARSIGGPDEDYFVSWDGYVHAMPAFGQPSQSVAAVPDGSYRLRLYVAVPYSPLDKPASYKSWLSPIITVHGVASAAVSVGEAEHSGTVRTVIPRINGYGDAKNIVANAAAVGRIFI